VISAVFTYSSAVPLGAFTTASKVKLTELPLAILKLDQLTVLTAITPLLLAFEMALYPIGTTSATDTFVAVSVPALLTNKVKVTVSPTFGVPLFTLFTKLKSACCGIMIDDVSSSSL